MNDWAIVAHGLHIPEGPVTMPDGSVLLVEIAAGRVTRVGRDGRKQVVATPGGGPNGLALGPGGKLFCCNNGGFDYVERDGLLIPHGQALNYSGGRIEVIDIDSGKVDILYKDGDFGCTLRGPNDIVFDRHGGFWFSDHGKTRARDRDVTGIFYASADGSYLEEVVFPSENPNGIGLSPDGSQLYAAETYTCRLMAFGRGRARPGRSDRRYRGTCHPALPPRRVQVLRVVGGQRERLHLCRDDRRVRDQCRVAGRRPGRVRRYPGRLHDQHLLGRGRPDGRVCDVIGQRPAGDAAMASARAHAGLSIVTSWSRAGAATSASSSRASMRSPASGWSSRGGGITDGRVVAGLTAAAGRPYRLAQRMLT